MYICMFLVFCDFESTCIFVSKIVHRYLYVIVQPFIPLTMYIYNTYAASDIIIRIIYSDYHQIWWHSLNIHSFFMPMSKHFFKRQPEQNLRVWVSSLQFPSKLHAKTWKSIKKTMRSSCLEPFLWNQIWHIFIRNWSAWLCNCLHNNLNITWFYHLFFFDVHLD